MLNDACFPASFMDAVRAQSCPASARIPLQDLPLHPHFARLQRHGITTSWRLLASVSLFALQAPPRQCSRSLVCLNLGICRSSARILALLAARHYHPLVIPPPRPCWLLAQLEMYHQAPLQLALLPHLRQDWSAARLELRACKHPLRRRPARARRRRWSATRRPWSTLASSRRAFPSATMRCIRMIRWPCCGH